MIALTPFGGYRAWTENEDGGMIIGLIGAGAIGSQLARFAVAHGHDVT
jgi:phosphoglycerate dehydrogenase-like enzyme